MTECVVCGKEMPEAIVIKTCSTDCYKRFEEIRLQLEDGDNSIDVIAAHYFKIRRLERRLAKMEEKP